MARFHASAQVSTLQVGPQSNTILDNKLVHPTPTVFPTVIQEGSPFWNLKSVFWSRQPFAVLSLMRPRVCHQCVLHCGCSSGASDAVSDAVTSQVAALRAQTRGRTQTILRVWTASPETLCWSSCSVRTTLVWRHMHRNRYGSIRVRAGVGVRVGIGHFSGVGVRLRFWIKADAALALQLFM